MKLSQIRQSTVETSVPVGDGQSIRLKVWTRKGTVSDQRELAKNVNAAMDALEEKRKQAGKIDRERDKILAPVVAKDDQLAGLQKQLREAEPEQRAALRKKIAAAESERETLLEELEPALEALNKSAQELLEAGQFELMKALGAKLEYYVESHNVTHDSGEVYPSKAEFYAENFDQDLLERCCTAVDEVLSGPLVTATATSS